MPESERLEAWREELFHAKAEAWPCKTCAMPKNAHHDAVGMVEGAPWTRPHTYVPADEPKATVEITEETDG